ncbi:MAG TPA: TolC family protein [Planctomycetaceae bacterium]|nr:TolC family protein [Planctomycetaceae bacterium]
MHRVCVALFGMVAVCVALSGCRFSDCREWNPGFKFGWFKDKDNDCAPCAGDEGDFYRTQSMRIEYTDVVSGRDDLPLTGRPATILTEGEVEYWDITLEESIRHALETAQVMRDLGGLVLRSPTNIRSIQEPAIQELDPRFGTEAALSAFDASFASSAFFEHNDRALNNTFFGGGTRVLKQDLATWQSQLSKTSAMGTEFIARSNIEYDANNAPGNTFPSAWTTILETEVRHPLLQGGGLDFNRIAGPGNVPGVINGVLISRINTDIALADFELSVRNLISDVENAYLDLYFAYRDLEARIRARDRALQTWRSIKALQEARRRGGEAARESQAREQYFRLQEEVQLALTGRLLEGTRTNNGSSGGTFRGTGGVHVAERRLRLLIGLPITDGRILRPVDEPMLAQVSFNWEDTLCEALSRRVEIRRQKWLIKSRELELVASRNFLLPELDLTGRYRWRGFGRDLFRQHDDASLSVGQANDQFNDPDQRFENRRFNNAFDNLFNGDFQEWQLGVEFLAPIGFRRAHAGVRYAELRLARERALLEEQERAVVHDLSNAIADVERAYALVETNYNRRVAADEQVTYVQEAYDRDDAPIDQLLDAQRKLTDAEVAYYRSLVEYQLALKNVHFEKGSLLDYNNVFLEEGPWPDKAYRDAAERDKLRHKPLFLDHCLLYPRIVGVGPAPQNVAVEGCPPGCVEGVPLEGVPVDGLPVDGQPMPPMPLEGQHELAPPPPPGAPTAFGGPSETESGAVAGATAPGQEYDPPGTTPSLGRADGVQEIEFLAPFEVQASESAPLAP